MAKFVENPKGFQVVQITVLDVFKFGGLGICDSCNKSQIDFFYIAVLNSCYCQECYNEWMERAINYSEDRNFESSKIEWIKKYLEIEKNDTK